METIVTEAFEWLKRDGAPVWLALFVVMAVLVIHSWMVKADPAAIIRSLLNVKKRRLENMLKQRYLTKETRTLIERELRQRSLWKLTRLFEHRLQDTAVLFTARFNVRADYLSKWRNWLSEREGQICFNRTWYQICLVLFWIGAVFDTAVWGGVVFTAAQKLSADYFAPALFFSTVPWLLWLIFTRVPMPAMTREMELRLQEFNKISQA